MMPAGDDENELSGCYQQVLLLFLFRVYHASLRAWEDTNLAENSKSRIQKTLLGKEGFLLCLKKTMLKTALSEVPG